jgi:thymidylate synthase
MAIDTADTATTAWRFLLGKLLDQGDLVSPRGKPTRELLGETTRIDMRYPVIQVAERKLGLRFMAAEAAWILSGDNRVSTIAPYSRDISEFSNDGTWFDGAYGPPLRDQLPYLVSTLAADNFSRQAVATIWRPRPGSSRDVPCTVSVQILLRKYHKDPVGVLRVHVIVNMRSSDAWLGWPYDVFNFTCLGYYVAGHVMRRTATMILPGRLTLTAGSQHLYERNVDGASVCLGDPDLVDVVDKNEVINLYDLKDDPDDLIEHLWWLANNDDWLGIVDSEQPTMSWLCNMFKDRYHGKG